MIVNANPLRRAAGRVVVSCAIIALAPGLAARADDEAEGEFLLRHAIHRATGEEVLYGTLDVFEDRAARVGRIIPLKIIALPAMGDEPAPDPVFILVGGPGQGATGAVGQYVDSWIRQKRDIVFVDQRGTGASNPLQCALSGNDANVQGYLDDIFDAGRFADCADALAQRANLELYTTPIAMDDLDEVRAALGYDKINLIGGSYGTRAALIYMRRHGAHVRTAILNGVAPPSFTNPLYHAREAQRALDLIFEECAADPRCSGAFPDLASKFEIVLQRLQAQPAEVTITHPVTGGHADVVLTRSAFAEALRMMMYDLSSSRSVPLLIQRAFEGDYEPFAQLGVERDRAVRNSLAFGMLMCVTCSEDIPRIREADIVHETAGTFLGDGRVRRQIAACDRWPRGEVDDAYGEPVVCDAPTLILSGALDPVTPPAWGEETARHLPNCLHVIAPGAHGVGGPCIESIMLQFLDSGSIENVDIDCVQQMRLPPFPLPEEGD